MWLEYRRYETAFADETDRLGEIVATTDPARAIPTCPEWTVRDLVGHVRTGHAWAADIIERRLTGPAPFVAQPAPDDPSAWPSWLREGSDRLTAAVRDVGPATPVWTWQTDRRAGFWVRRMLHDEIIHRFDVELALGRTGELDPDLAVDGVRDWLTTVATLSVADMGFAGIAGTGQTLHLQATDPESNAPVGDWLVERTPAGATWQVGAGPADVQVRGPALELLLVLNRRRSPDRLEVSGDGDLFTHWLEHSRF
jgi:uncharacterized protein (TIGR03083 family)